jgi:colicin import membrane protein
MKHLLACAFALVAAFSAQAQDEAADRARIKAERAAADARFEQARKDCRKKFAVTDCEKEAKRLHNAQVGELRRQERVLNDADRKRRAAERQKAIDERNSPEQRQQAEEKRQRALADQKEREQRAAEKAAKRAEDDAERAKKGPRVKVAPGPHGPQGTPRTPAGRKSHEIPPEEAAKNRAAYEARLKEAEKHKAEVLEKAAKRSKPPASALPAPR